MVCSGLVNCLSYSPNGDALASGDSTRGVTVWDRSTLRNTATAEGRTMRCQGAVMSLAFSPTGGTLAAGDATGQVTQWDWAQPQKLHSMQRDGAVRTLQYSPSGW